ncbi:MAG: lysophospholipid acyltransferase family protein [Clostridia bacterium]|nr:lysophospholipid acyltransferase family protein [Clostridia bacterium]
MSERFYKAVITIIKPFLKFFYPFEVRGLEKIKNAKKNYIICCNHLSNVDVAFLMVTHEKLICFMAKEELFKNKILGWFFKKMGAFAVKRGKGDKSALINSENIIKNGNILGIFIEGTRSKTGEFLRPKSGATLIASKTNADILPICITGSGENNKVKLFKKTIISYGDFIPNNAINCEDGSRSALKESTNKIMDSITKLRQD